MALRVMVPPRPTRTRQLATAGLLAAAVGGCGGGSVPDAREAGNVTTADTTPKVAAPQSGDATANPETEAQRSKRTSGPSPTVPGGPRRTFSSLGAYKALRDFVIEMNRTDGGSSRVACDALDRFVDEPAVRLSADFCDKVLLPFESTSNADACTDLRCRAAVIRETGRVSGEGARELGRQNEVISRTYTGACADQLGYRDDMIEPLRLAAKTFPGIADLLAAGDRAGAQRALDGLSDNSPDRRPPTACRP